MGVGKIRDFSKPDPDKQASPQVLSAVKNQGVQISQEPQPVEVKIHEEIIEEGQDQIRRPVYEDGIEIRVRGPKDPAGWRRVKEGRDDE